MTAAATDLKQAPSAQPFEAGPRSDVIDDALAILRGTHDGDELDRLHLQMVELAVNAGSLAVFNERGVEVWRKLVADVRSGAYQARWFHDQENLRIDHQGYVRWRDKVEKRSIHVPLIPGLLPILNFPKMRTMAARCNATVPDFLHTMFEGVDPDSMDHKLLAMNVLSHQITRLVEHGVPHFHFYTMNETILTRHLCKWMRAGF